MPLDPTLNELSDQQSMTHYAPQPNPAAPYLDAARNFYSGGLTQAFPAIRQAMPGWLNDIGSLFQGQAARDALSTANTGGILPLLEIMSGTRGFEELAARGEGGQALSDLDLAKQMEARGMDRSQIRAAAKWYKEGPSGVWNKEIFDYPSNLNMLEVPSVRQYLPKETTVGKVLNHPELYKVYPHLKDMPLYFGEDILPRHEFAGYAHPSGKAKYGTIIVNNPHNTNPQELQLSILHELQHAVDKYEGRPLRLSRTQTLNDYLKSIEEGRARNTEWRSKYPEDVLMQPGMDPWKTMEKMRNPYREEQFTLPP